MENNPDERFSFTSNPFSHDVVNLDNDSILHTPVPQASSTIDQHNRTLTRQVCRLCFLTCECCSNNIVMFVFK